MGSIRVFHLDRIEDESGISGTGRVAEGIEFSDGSCVVHWLSHTPSTNFYQNMKQVESIHGHGGKTRIVFDYEETPAPAVKDVLPPSDIEAEQEPESQPKRKRKKKESTES